MKAALSVLLLSFVASPALAGHLTMGATVGLEQSQANATDNGSQLLGLFGRLGLVGRLSGQLELARIATPDNSQMDVRTGTGLLVLDLGAGTVTPIVFAGVGADQQTMTYGSSTFVHGEAGVGLELRAKNGFVVGADARIGTRSMTSAPLAMPEACCSLYSPISPIAEGQYRSLRVTLGVTF